MTEQQQQQADGQRAGRREAPEAMAEAMVDAAAAPARGAPAQTPAPSSAAAGPDPVDWWTERLVDAGEFEGAVADALLPERDGLPPAAGALRRLSLAAARGLAAAHRAAGARTPGEAEYGAAAVARAHARLAAAAHLAAVAVRDAGDALAGEVPVRLPSGFADGGVYPETYAAAARRFAARVGPARALVVGVRGTGAGLAAVVADTLARRGVEVRSVTVRPPAEAGGGLAADAALDALLRDAAAAPGAWAAVVDEGPDAGAGGPGAAFAGAAAALAERGFDPARVVLFPSWDAETLGGHRRFVAGFDDAVLARGGVRCHHTEPGCRHEEVGADPRGLGARAYRCAADHGGDGPVRLAFVGLGRYGRERLDAARRRAEAGEGPPVFALRRGYLVTADAEGAR